MSQAPGTLPIIAHVSTAAGPRYQYDLAFQIAPILLVNGIVQNQGKVAPITSYMGSLVGSGPNTGARFLIVPGSTLLSQQIGMYPFANQFVAANATIVQPLTLSIVMIAPINQAGGYLTKLNALTALQSSLANHNALGGTYHIVTPGFLYTYCLITSVTDVTAEDSEQKQIQYQFDFIQPIITLGAAAGAVNNLMQNVNNGTQLTGPPSWSGQPGASPANLTGVIPALAAFEQSP